MFEGKKMKASYNTPFNHIIKWSSPVKVLLKFNLFFVLILSIMHFCADYTFGKIILICDH